MKKNPKPLPPKALAIGHIQSALEICDRLGLDSAACHLQMGLDLLLGWSTTSLALIAEKEPQ